MYKPVKAHFSAAGLLLLPHLTTLLPFAARLCVLSLLFGTGLLFWWQRRSRGAFLLSTCVLVGWISLASFPLVISKWESGLLYGLLTAALLAPWTCFDLLRPHWSLSLVLWFTAAFFLLLDARPGRRFAEGAEAPEIKILADAYPTVEEATRFVHLHIEDRRGPPTDTALDTLRRGYGRCGAMNNLLHKLLVAQGHDAGIIHLDGNAQHTMVEINRNQLADAQENRIHFISPQQLIGTKDAVLPLSWTQHRRLWGYDEYNGYERIRQGDHRGHL